MPYVELTGIPELIEKYLINIIEKTNTYINYDVSIILISTTLILNPISMRVSFFYPYLIFIKKYYIIYM